jgi:hypothetical protein
MKKTIFALCLVSLLTSLSVSHAQTVIATWDYDAGGTIAAPYNTNAATGGANMTMAWATQVGMSNNYTFNNGEGPGSLANCDVLATAGASTGSGAFAWRVRGNGNTANSGTGVANGWNSQAPIGTQGAEFFVDTTTYNNITVSVDINDTAQGEGKLAILYTTNDAVANPIWFDATLTSPGSLGTIGNNTTNPNTVMGNYAVLGSAGNGWNNQIQGTCTLAGNDPNFAVAIVNAATGADCVNAAGSALNNSSGNWRFDNIVVSGTTGGALATPPTLTNSSTATVDGPFTNTFADSPVWRGSIAAVTVNGATLLSGFTVSPGQIVFTPALSSPSSLLQKSGTANIVIYANNFNPDPVSQPIAPGAAKILNLSTQPAGPTGNGGTLVAQPALAIADQYGNAASNNATATYTATPSAGWSFGPGSSSIQMLANGTCVFTNLSAVSAGAVSGATITFTASGATGLNGLAYTTTNSIAFNIPAPIAGGFTPGYLAVEQVDNASSANSTFTILELNPAVSNASPANVFPIPATQTNGLRQSGSTGSTGDLSDSDDGTLLCFSAGLWQDSTLGDVTTVTNRGAGTFNYQGAYNLGAFYQGNGGSTADQPRSATTIDDTTFYMGDKGGVYTNDENIDTAYIPFVASISPANVRSMKSFGGTIYVLQQEGGTDPSATVMATLPLPGSGASYLVELDGFPLDGSVLDFYALRSGNNGANYDTIYYIDGTNTTSGSIWKWYFTGTSNELEQQVWNNSGGDPGDSWPTTNGGNGLCVVTNINGGVDLYYTTGSGSTAGNSVVHAYDANPWNQPINITQSSIIYTAPAGVCLKGIAFAPVPLIGSLSSSGYNGTGFSFNFTSLSSDATSAGFTVWSTTNLLTPFAQWKNLGNPTGPTGPGANVYSFTDTSAKSSSHTFYKVTSP